MPRYPAMVVLLLCATWGIGCASKSPETAAPPAHFDPAEVILPAETPFDNDAAMRAVYQNYYWFGYALALRGIGESFCDNEHPWYLVQLRGFSDGQRDGFSKKYAKERRQLISPAE